MSLQETLRAFSVKQKSADDVMRAIMNHDAWQAPVLYAAQVLNTEVFDRLAIWGTGDNTPSNGELWLFSDDAAGHAFVNKGFVAGPFATALTGWKLFEKLSDGIASVRVNPGSPNAEGWYIERAGFELTRLWAQAVAVEQQLAAPGDKMIEMVVNFPAYTILIHPNAAIVTATGAGGMKNPGMVFTTPDCADAVLRDLPPANAATIRKITASGRRLFEVYPKMGVDGLLFNPRGPGVPQALPGEVCDGIIGWIASDAEATRLEAEARRMGEGT